MSIPGPELTDVLSVRGVSKAFGAVQALRDVSVDVRAGEIHALVGENGSGKSTLLGICSGFLAPDGGAVVIGDRLCARGDGGFSDGHVVHPTSDAQGQGQGLVVAAVPSAVPGGGSGVDV